ncbi:nuclear transport factor 2 family protein [Paraferrimonas sp. SM1919]|uniref:nuclear transport factor 2 family protein n=1 Tax=Paraferrimonas sp. SM1919 TaxID=2662263 RepID=UPI0013D64193|nr:nuclear transport factor 2 family protein [Paraferrimonas sp. SM1919]
MYACLSILILFFSSFSFGFGYDSLPKEQQMALQYMRAVTDNDYRKLLNFYNRDSTFEDRTAGKSYTGARDILTFLKRAHAHVHEYEFNIEQMYNSGSLVIMIGNYYLKGPGKQFGKPGKIIEVAIPGVTTLIVDVNNHRIKKHTDLLDYAAMKEQLSMQY